MKRQNAFDRDYERFLSRDKKLAKLIAEQIFKDTDHPIVKPTKWKLEKIAKVGKK